MPWTAAAIVGGALIGAQASKSSASSQSLAAQAAANQQQAMFNATQANQQAFLNQGKLAVNEMGALTGPSGTMSTAPTAQDIMQYMAPNYQFQLQQGLGQAGAQANSTGGMVSGNALQGLNQFAQNYAQGAYQNAFNNYQAAQTNIFNRLASIAGLGQTAANTVSNTGMNTAFNIGNFATSGAAAQAAGQVGAANAYTQGLNQLGGLYYAKNQPTYNTNQMSMTLGG